MFRQTPYQLLALVSVLAVTVIHAESITLGAPIQIYPLTSMENDEFNSLDYPDSPVRCFVNTKQQTLCYWGNSQYGTPKAIVEFSNPTNSKQPFWHSVQRFDNSSLPDSVPDTDSPPYKFYNHVWLNSLWARNAASNESVIAIIHNEFHGWQDDKPSTKCTSGSKIKCWYPNSILATSTDDGDSFVLPATATERIVVSTPYEYLPDGGSTKNHQGIVHSTNIIKKASDGYYYMWAQSSVGNKNNPTPYSDGSSGGMCLYRTNNISVASSWRGSGDWSSNPVKFSVKNINPYTQPSSKSNICTPNPDLQKYSIYSLSSWTYNTILKKYIAIGIIKLNNNKNYSHQIFYTLSNTGFTWSKPIMLKAIHWISDWPKSSNTAIAYCSIIDPSSTTINNDRNYQYSGAKPWLICTKFQPPKSNPRRILIAYPMTIKS
jgi:hypothetical protein